MTISTVTDLSKVIVSDCGVCPRCHERGPAEAGSHRCDNCDQGYVVREAEFVLPAGPELRCFATVQIEVDEPGVANNYDYDGPFVRAMQADFAAANSANMLKGCASPGRGAC